MLTDRYYMQDLSNKMFIIFYFKKKVSSSSSDIHFIWMQKHQIIWYSPICNFAFAGEAELKEQGNWMARVETLFVQTSLKLKSKCPHLFFFSWQSESRAWFCICSFRQCFEEVIKFCFSKGKLENIKFCFFICTLVCSINKLLVYTGH